MNIRYRFVLCAVAALALSPWLPGIAAAQQQHSGSWKSVQEGSYWSTGDFPKTFSLQIDMAFSANELKYHSVNDSDPAKVGVLDFVSPTDGQVRPIEGQTRYNQVSVKWTGPDDLEILQLKDGDVIVASFYTFSRDGKSFVRRGVGKSPEGKSKAYQEYFVKR